MHHKVDHGQVDDVLRSLGEEFIVLAEAAVTAKPSEGALDYPPLGEEFKAYGGVASLNDLKTPTRPLLDPFRKIAGIAAVGPELFHPWAIIADFPNQSLGPVAILNVRGVYKHSNDQSQGIDDKMSLASFNFLASVVTARRPPFSPVFADWLSMIPALGFASRPSSSRNLSWSPS